MDDQPNGVRHDDEVSEDPDAPEQRISLAGDDLDGAERLGERLDRFVETHERVRPVAQQFVSIPRTARVALVFLRKGAAAGRTAPRRWHRPSTPTVRLWAGPA